MTHNDIQYVSLPHCSIFALTQIAEQAQSKVNPDGYLPYGSGAMSVTLSDIDSPPSDRTSPLPES